jgi:hypothetical protein
VILVHYGPAKRDIALSGSVTVTLFENGTGIFSGSFHDAGALAYNIGVAGVVRIKGLAIGFKADVSVSETFETGSRDVSWNNPFIMPAITANWKALGLGCVDARFPTQWFPSGLPATSTACCCRCACAGAARLAG